MTANTRYLQTAALEQPQKPADKVRSSWFHDEKIQDSVTTIQLDSMTPECLCCQREQQSHEGKNYFLSVQG